MGWSGEYIVHSSENRMAGDGPVDDSQNIIWTEVITKYAS
jgi:hypothetical protein